MNNQLVSVNGTVGLLVETTDDTIKVVYGFGSVEHTKENVVLEFINSEEIPSHLVGISYEDIINYTKGSKKRIGDSKMDLAKAIFEDLVGENGINLTDGAIAPKDIKEKFCNELDMSSVSSSTYYYKIKGLVEEELKISLDCPKKPKKVK